MQDFMITRKGEELIARMIAGTDSCTFTKAVTSDHKYMNAEDISSLEDIRQTIPLSGIIINDGDTVKVTALLSNKEQEQGYYVRALGLYACDSSENEILYAVSIEPDNPDYMPAFAGKTLSTISYIMNIRVGRSERVKLNVDTGAIPTVEQVNLMQRTIESLEREKVNKTDIIDVTHGGTGKTTEEEAANTLLGGLKDSNDHWYDDQNILIQGSAYTSAKDKYYRKPTSKLFEWIKAKLSKVAESGSYNDLSDKPTIPTIPQSLPASGGHADTATSAEISAAAKKILPKSQVDTTQVGAIWYE